MLMLLLALCASAGCRHHKDNTGLYPVSIRLQWIHQAQFAGIYAAKVNGYYRDAGLDVSVYQGGADLNAIKLVASGSNDFGIWTADQLVLARAQGIPIKGVAAIFQKSLACFIAKASSHISSVRDFPHHTVGVSYGYDNETLYIEMLKRAGVPRSTIHETPVQYDLARFWDGEVDVWPSYLINQPITAKELGVPITIIDPEDYGIRSYSDILFTTDSMIKDHPDIVAKFVEATQKGWNWALDNPDSATALVLKQDQHLNWDHERSMLEIESKLVRPDKGFIVGTMETTRWSSIYSMLNDQDAIRNPLAVTDVYSTQFVPVLPEKRQ
jgi:ABC-type nitrate/sulfonate/bicarbonate transport system substrate-binding protein